MDSITCQPTANPARKRLVVAGIAALAVVLGVIGLLLWQYGRIASNVRPSREVASQVRAVLSPEPTSTPAPPAAGKKADAEPATYVLVMGTEGGSKTPLSTLLLVRLAGNDARASVLWIPPKAEAKAAGSRGSVSDAFVAGGPAAAIRRVKEVTGLPVHHYVRFDALGIASALDAMGGVRVDPSLKPAPSTSPTAPPVAREGGMVLDGSEVLAFARRSEAGGVEERQGLLVVNAALSQARTKLLGPSALGLLLAVSRITETDMGPRGLYTLGESMRGAIRADVTQHYLSGPRRGGVMRIAADDRRVRATISAFASAR